LPKWDKNASPSADNSLTVEEMTTGKSARVQTPASGAVSTTAVSTNAVSTTAGLTTNGPTAAGRELTPEEHALFWGDGQLESTPVVDGTAHPESASAKQDTVEPVTFESATPERAGSDSMMQFILLGGLGLIMLVSFFMRTANIDFDNGQHQHPDERFWSFVLNDAEWPDSVGEYLSSSESTLNPYNPIKEDGSGYPTFSYGTMPLYTTKAVSQYLSGGGDDAGSGKAVTGLLNFFGVDLRRSDGSDIFNDRYDANIIGRLISAFLDTMTVGLVYFLARSVSSRERRDAAGLLAAGLYAFAVLPIQYSHFLGAEPWVAFFVTATLLGSVRIAKERAGPFTYLITGLCVGLAIASKLSGLPAAIAPITAVVIASWGGYKRDSAARVMAPWAGLIGMLVVGFGVFRVALPYAFVDGVNINLNPRAILGRDIGTVIGLDQRYLSDMAYIRDVNTGGGFNWVIQWAGRTPLLYPLRELFNWGMGPALTIASLTGIVIAAHRVLRRCELYFLVPLSVIGVFVAFVALQFNPLNRYLLPAYPAAVALAGFGLVQLWHSRRPSPPSLPSELFHHWRSLARVSVALMTLFTAFYGAAYVNGVYFSEYTRIEASHWLVDNIPAGATISSQAWDDALPLTLPDDVGVPNSGTYGWWEDITVVQTDPFFPDSSRKVTDLVQQLDQVDYVVEASNKLYGAIPQMPAKFPATVAYYGALFDGSLGFERVADFTTPPSLFGIELNDRYAEETFTVYDHPPVTIWQKTDRYSTSNALRLLDPYRADTAIDHQPRQAGANALQLTPVAYETQQSGGTWTETFNEDGLVTKAPWFWWLLWLQVASFAALPLTTWLFRSLPDHGYGLSKIVGLLLVGLSTFMIASLGIANFTDTLVWVLLGVLILAGLVALRKSAEFTSMLKSQWKSWMAAEVVFLGIFFVFVLLRYANPDIWHPYRGGEKPMEMSYLTAIIKSTTLPAYDPWFAGGFLNYYYVGWFLLAVPAKAMHLPPDLAFNLGLATYAAMAGSVVHSLVSNLAGAARQTFADGRGSHDTTKPVVGAGLLGVFLFMFLGNFDSARQTWYHLRGLSTTRVLDGKRGDSTMETLSGIWNLITKSAPEDRRELTPFDWWAPSRVNKGTGDITEFPAWTFLFGDLHPHLMGMVFLGLMLATAVALVMALRVPFGRFGPRTWVLAASLGAGAAVVRMVHTWDWPTVLIVAGVSIVLGWALTDEDSLLRRSRGAMAQLLVFGVSYLFFSLPYRGSNEVFSSGFQFRAPSDTNFDDFIAHWLFFLVAALLYVLVRWGQLNVDLTTRTGMWLIVVGTTCLALVAHLAVGSVMAWAIVGFGLAMMLTVGELVDTRRSIGHIAASGFFALAFAILAGVEWVGLASDSQGFNTIFKFWIQVWQLFAVAGAFAIWWVLASLRNSIQEKRENASYAIFTRMSRVAIISGLAVLVLLASIFPFRGVPRRVNDDASLQTAADAGWSLKGFRWLEEENTVSLWDVDNLQIHQDAGIIRWLRDNVEGSPTIAEAWGPGYQWFNRISMTTGLPSVLGWDWHQRQQRACTAPAEFCTSPGFARQIDIRKDALRSFYTVPDELLAEQFLLTYDVSYVVVGSSENALRKEGGNVIGPVMGDEVKAMFAAMASMVEVYREGDAVIYEIDKEELRRGKYTYEALQLLQP